MKDRVRQSRKYTQSEREAALAHLARNGGGIAKTARELGISRTTIRVWDLAARAALAATHSGSGGAGQGDSKSSGVDLMRFTRDAWEIIHKANEVVRDGISEIPAKEASSIAAGYFDRQAKALEQLGAEGAGEEYVVRWQGEK